MASRRSVMAALAGILNGRWVAEASAEDTAPVRTVPAPLPLHDAYDPNNPFAQIIRGERFQAKVYEDRHVLAFMDHAPMFPGHTLVISKTSRARNLLDEPPQDLARLLAIVRRVGEAQIAGLGVRGFTVIQNNGAGQTVPHLHFHVIPRVAGEQLVFGPKAKADEADLEAVAAKIRAAMRS